MQNPSNHKTFQNGQHYMKTWPLDKRLSAVFPENRVIKATQFAIRFMPPIAVFTFVWQILVSGQLGLVIATALFACSLPMQGLWWLGKRSQKQLSPSLQRWFQNICQKLVEANFQVKKLQHPPTYQDLADLLKIAFKQIDSYFLDEL